MTETHTSKGMYAGIEKDLHNGNMEKSSLIAINIWRFCEVMFAVLSECGFSGKELCTKFILFLKAVTQRYPDHEFLKVLSVFSEADEKFVKSVFYASLINLRAICNVSKKEDVLIALLKFGVSFDSAFQSEKDVVDICMFSNNLIEQLIRLMKDIDGEHDIENLSEKQLTAILHSLFYRCLQQAVSSNRVVTIV